MTYDELYAAIQSYTENEFPQTYLADGSTVSTQTQINTFIKQTELRIYNTVQFPSLRKNVMGVLSSGNKYLSLPSDFLATYSLAVIDDAGSYEFLLNKDVNFIRQAYPSPTDTAIPKYYALFGPTTTNDATPVITDELSAILGPTPDAAYDVELHYYYYPESIIRGQLSSVGTITAGSGYTNGTYFNVPLTGGSGSSATATITVAGGVVTAVAVSESGCCYVVGDTLSAAFTSIGGTGSGFSVPVSAVLNANGTSWLGDNFDTVLLYGCLVEAYVYMKGESDMLTTYQTKYQEALMQAKRLGDGMERSDAYRSGQFRMPPLAQNNGVQ